MYLICIKKSLNVISECIPRAVEWDVQGAWLRDEEITPQIETFCYFTVKVVACFPENANPIVISEAIMFFISPEILT